jgi:hypothetical protein
MGWSRWLAWRLLAVFGVGAVVLSCLPPFVRGALGDSLPDTTLTVRSGTVGVVFSDGQTSQPAESGLVLERGDRVATVGRDSAASLHFADGSRVDLGADTTVQLHLVRVSRGGPVSIYVEVISGVTTSHVRIDAADGSRFDILAGSTVAIANDTTLITVVTTEAKVSTGYQI